MIFSARVVAGFTAAPGEGICALKRTTTLNAAVARASDKMDSCSIRDALQLHQDHLHAPQYTGTRGQSDELVAVLADGVEVRWRSKCNMLPYEHEHQALIRHRRDFRRELLEVTYRLLNQGRAGGEPQTSLVLAEREEDPAALKKPEPDQVLPTPKNPRPTAVAEALKHERRAWSNTT